MNSMRRQRQRRRQRQHGQRNTLNGITKKCYKYECNLQIKNNIRNVSTIKTWMPSIIVIVRQRQQQQQQRQLQLELQQIKTKYFRTNSVERKQCAIQQEQRQRQQEDKHHYHHHQHQQRQRQRQYNHQQRVQQHRHQQQQQLLPQSKRGISNATEIYANTYSTTADTSSLITKTTTRTTTTKTGTKRLVIIMMLVFSIIQQQQQQQQQQEYQQSFSYNGVYAAAIAATQMPADVHYNSNNLNEQGGQGATTGSSVNGKKERGSGNFEQLRPQPQTQTEATNHTFKTFAFIDGYHTAQTTPTDVEVTSESLPIFDFGMPRNITGRTGHTEAIIKCRVDRLNDKSVSWIRKRDLHILTVGTATYTSDKRFLVTESKNSREWTLHVKAPQARDSGIYECQVNTEPKMSMAFQLNIIEISPDAKAVIIGPPDLHFKVGSAIILNCVVQQPSIKDIGPMYWYRGEHMITPFDADDSIADAITYTDANDIDNYAVRQDVYANKALNDVITNELQKDFATRIAMETQLGDTLKSRLRIANAQTTDTGNYTCQPTTARSASVLVHVINDENPAAMQKSAAVASVKLRGMGNSMVAILKDVACLLLMLLF